MTYHELISRLSSHYEQGEARAIVRMLLESITELSWTEVLCGGIEGLEKGKKDELETLMQRLENGEPIQYVLGEAEFWGHLFHVEQGVLIPRIETEELVAEVIKSAEDIHDNQCIKILDIGTGSGCIAISIALELERKGSTYEVEAVDISPEALRIASANAEKLSARHISFRQVDFLDASQTSTLPSDYTFIVSNPPYICNKERVGMENNVLEHEPELALFVPNEDPLLFYRTIAEFAEKHLLPNGHIHFEINRAYGKETARLLTEHGFRTVEVKKDQFGNDRIVSCIK